MTEDDLLRGVLDIARVYGWRVLHIRPARTAHGWRTPVQGDGIGWPDLFMVRGDRLLAAELKSAHGRLTNAQADWLAALDGAGVAGFVWSPADYPDDVARILR